MSQPPIIPAPGTNYARALEAPPGMCAWLGIISIVVGSVSILACIFAAVYAVLMMNVGPAVMPSTSPAPPPAVMVAAPVKQVQVGPDGIASPAVREAIMAGLQAHQPLQLSRVDQLDALLADAGKLMFDRANGGADAVSVQVAEQITESGRLYRPSGDGPQYFRFPRGSIEVSDDQAVFFPADGPERRVSAEAGADASTDVVSESPPAAAPPGAAWAYAVAGEVPGRVIVAVLSQTLLSMLLAGLLLVAGVMMLHGSARSLRPHWMYVLVKIPLIIGSIATWWWFADSIAQASRAASPPWADVPSLHWPTLVLAMMFAIFGLIYPIALLFMLPSRTLREYFAKR